jgi:hypothetical protein
VTFRVAGELHALERGHPEDAEAILEYPGGDTAEPET